MTESAFPEILHHDSCVTPIEIKNQVVQAGTFQLRRANYLSEIEQGLLLNAEQRLALISLIKADNFDAKQKVLSHNLGLVASIAMRYVNRGVEFLELVREGTMGLIQALEKFELEGGFRFSVYARWCIRENIEYAIMTRTCYQPL